MPVAILRRRTPSPLLFAVTGIVVGVVFAVLAYHSWSRDQALRRHGATATAHVVEITGKGKGRRVHVEFPTAAGGTARAKVEGYQQTAGARVGDQFPIRYDTRAPEHDVYDARRSDQHKMTYLLAVCAAFAFVGPPLLAWFSLRHRRR